MVNAFDFSQPGAFTPNKYGSIAVFINIILPLMTTGAAIIFLVMMLRAAFVIITHGDNPEAIKKAQQSMGFAILGLFIVLLSFLLVQLFGKMLGVANILPI